MNHDVVIIIPVPWSYVVFVGGHAAIPHLSYPADLAP